LAIAAVQQIQCRRGTSRQRQIEKEQTMNNQTHIPVFHHVNLKTIR
jgi:hypothetical protein